MEFGLSEAQRLLVDSVSGWLRDRDFCDAGGQPLALDPEGDLGFAGLVKRHSGDMPTRAVLDELLRVGAVARQPDGLITLQARGYVPRHGVREMVDVLGEEHPQFLFTAAARRLVQGLKERLATGHRWEDLQAAAEALAARPGEALGLCVHG